MTGSSDLEGRFKVLLPERGRVDIVARPMALRGGKVVGGRIEDVGGDTSGHVLRLSEVSYDQALSVRTFTPSGKPAPGIHVYARIAGQNIPGANVRTDAKGEARLRCLPDEDVVLHARALPGTPEAERWTELTLHPVRARGQRLDLRLENAVVMEGRAVDAAGVPLPGAYVVLSSDQEVVVTETADEQGAFRLRMSSRRHFPLRLTATHQGRAVAYGMVSPETPLPIKIVFP